MNRMIQRKKAAIATSQWTAEKAFALRDRSAVHSHSILRPRVPESSLHGEVVEAKAFGDGSGNLRINTHVRVFHFRMQDARQCVNQSQSTSFRQRQPHRESHDRVRGHLGIHAPQQLLNPFARQRGYKNRSALLSSFSACAVGNNFSIFGRKLIHFVQHAQPWAPLTPSLPKILSTASFSLSVLRVETT